MAVRRLLSPPEMLNADGTIDQDFFKPKQVCEEKEERRRERRNESILLNSFFFFLLLFSKPRPRPKKKNQKQVIIVEDKKWGPAERDALYKGLEIHGVGGWRAMVDSLLPRWEETALRVKAGRLMGTQSLARYVGWKGNKEAVDAEFAKNKELGEVTGCWKGGVLVEDDAGSVAAELARRAAAAAAAK